MGGFNRDQFKPASMVAIKTQEGEANAKRPSGNNNLFGKIEDGRNVLRLYPVHPNGGGTVPWEAHCVSWLPVTSKARDENKRVIEGQVEIRRKSVFNSKVHGNTPKDLVEEYLRLVKEDLFKNSIIDKAQQDTIWGWLTSFESKDAIQPQDSWAVYASKLNGQVWGPVEQFDLKKTVKTYLNSLAAELSGDDPISPEPFTDPTEGIPVVIIKGKDPKNPSKTVYSAVFARVGAGRQSNYMDAPLSDDQLEQFLKLDSLSKIYVDSYKRKDLLMQLEGLKNIDDQLKSRRFKTKAGVDFVAGASIFDLEEFQALIDQMLDLYPEESVDQEAQGEEIVDNGGEVVTDVVTDELPWDKEETVQQQAVTTARTSPRQPVQQQAAPPVQRRQPSPAPAPPVRTAKAPVATKPAPATNSNSAESAEQVAARLKEANARAAALDEQIKKIRGNMGKKPTQ